MSFGRDGRDEEIIKQGLFLGGTLGCGSNLEGTRSSERKIKRSGRPGEGGVCLDGERGADEEGVGVCAEESVLSRRAWEGVVYRCAPGGGRFSRVEAFSVSRRSDHYFPGSLTGHGVRGTSGASAWWSFFRNMGPDSRDLSCETSGE